MSVSSSAEPARKPNRNSRSKGKIDIPKRGKASRAAYGHIRSIADLEYDELENDPLLAHRRTCERCQRKPTHILLELQRKSGKRNKSKRKPKDEFEEDSGTEDELVGLGGWVRWQVCAPMFPTNGNKPIVQLEVPSSCTLAMPGQYPA
jgi:hypothetical protein